MDNLIQRLSQISDYSVSNAERGKTYQLCEDYKLNHFTMADLDIFLMPGRHVNVQRFGLQCMDYKIKQCWSTTVPTDKCLMKDSLFRLISSLCGGNSLLPASEESILLLPISDVLVHMIKCEWPQQWPSMMSELLTLSRHGYFQTKLVLASLLRLSQDVMQLDNVLKQRKKEIVGALHDNIGVIFDFCLSTMMEQLQRYQNTTGDLHLASQALSLCKESILTLTGFLDWVKMECICQKDGLLFQLLVSLLRPHKDSAFSVQSPAGLCTSYSFTSTNRSVELDDDSLKWTNPMAVKAIEAVLVALSRKDKVEQRESLIIILENDAIFQPILSCTKRIAQMEKPLERITDMEFEFLHRLCETLVRLGCLCLQVWPHKYKDNLPPNWSALLECLVFFTKYPSKMICEEPCEFWYNLYAHSSAVIVSQGQPLVAILHSVFMQNVVKKPCDDLSRRLLEADDYTHFFARSRGVFLRCIYAISQAFPDESMSCLFTQTQQYAEKIITSSVSDFNHYLLEGEATVLYSDNVLRILPRETLSTSTNNETTSPQTSLISRFLKPGYTILSEILKCMDTLVVPNLEDNSLQTLQLLPILTDLARSFLIFAQLDLSAMLPIFLTKLFLSLQWKMPSEDSERRPLLVNMHMNCTLNFLRVCQQHRQFFMTYFSQLMEYVQNAVKTADCLGSLQRSMLLQGLVTLSATFQDFNKQQGIIFTLFQPLLVPTWTEGELANAVLNPESFFSYVGLTEPANGPQRMEYNRRRYVILSTLYALVSCIRSSQVPADAEAREKGGFLQFVNGRKIIRNPISSLLMPIMPTFFHMLNCLTILNSDEGYTLVNSSYRDAFKLSEHMKLTILGKLPPSMTCGSEDIPKNSTEIPTNGHTSHESKESSISNGSHSIRSDVLLMQKFIMGSYETICQLLGHATTVLVEDLYMVPQLAKLALKNLAFRHILTLKNFKLHVLLKYFVRMLIEHCPSEYFSTVLVPVIPYVISNTFARVENHWQLISAASSKSRMHNNEDEDERDELSDEVIEEHCTRVLTRTAVDLVKLTLLFNGPPKEKVQLVPGQENGNLDDNEMTSADMDSQQVDEDGEQSMTATQNPNAPSDVLGTLGRLVCSGTSAEGQTSDDSSHPPALVLLAALANAITWPDTLVCHRAAPLIIPLLKEMQRSCPMLVTEAVVTQVFLCLLTSFTINGHHKEAVLPFLLNAAVQLYELFRPQFSHLPELLQAASHLSMDRIQTFEKKLFTSPKKMNDRNKRDSFRNLVEPLIGVPLSEHFKENVHIKNLPALIKQKWKAPSNILDCDDEEDSDAGVFRSLFTDM